MLKAGDEIDIWVVERALGQGGMGSVYRCHNRSAQRILAAVKVLDPALARVATAKARFVREAEILFALDHPNIVKVRNVRMDAEMPYLEMEFVDGQSLEDLIQRGPVPLRQALTVLAQVADALAYLHDLGVRHRDIKPSNILLQGGRAVKLVDFGIATEQGGPAITESGQAFGSVSYAPPEWIDPKRLDAVRWDIYALGVVAFELLTGRMAFPTERAGTSRQQALQVMIAKQDHAPLDPGPGFPEPLRQLLAHMTRADPLQRADSAAEVRRRVEALLATLKDAPPAEARREYEVLETLGEGGFGTVYRARFIGESGFSKEVALKVLHPDMADHPEVAQRLRDEARMLGLLRHRAIVQVDRLTRLGGRWALVMEYVRGADLKQVLEAHGPIPAACALEIAAEVAGALHTAYASPGPDGQPLKLVHRDIKPPNLHLTPFGEVKILDFGIARAEFADREAHTQKLSFGSIGYMAPERLDMSEGPAGDVYSLGAVLYELLTGEAIGRTAASPKRHEAILEPVRERLGSREGVSPALAALILDMLAWEPDARPSAREVERRCLSLRRELSGEPLRYWTEEVVTPILTARAQTAAARPPEGGLSGVVLAEGERAESPSTFDPDETLPDGPAPGADHTLPDSDGHTWYPGVIEPHAQVSTPTMVPAPGTLVADDLPLPPPPAGPAQEQPVQATPHAAARQRATEALPRRAEPAPEPAPPTSDASRHRGLLIAVVLLTALLGVVMLWPAGGPPAPRAVELILTGLPSGSEALARLRPAEGPPLTGQAEGEHLLRFEAVPPGSWVIEALQGGPGCAFEAPGPECALTTEPVEVPEGEGAHVLRLSLAPAPLRPLEVEVPGLAERPDLTVFAELLGPEGASTLRRLPLVEGRARFEDLPPGRYQLAAAPGPCEGEAPCAPPGEPLTLAWQPEPAPAPRRLAFELPPPPPDKKTGKPPPSSTAPPEPDGPRAARAAVTVSQFAAWLADNEDWQRDAALAEGRADPGYLRGWDGATPPGGASGAMVGVSWAAARAYCAGRGGLAEAEAEPLSWEETAASPWHEYRQAGGRPAWRRKDGTVSTSVKSAESSPVIGFRCAR